MGKLKMLPKLAEIGSAFPQDRQGRPVQGGRRPRRLLAARLPVLQCWPQDGGPLHHPAAGVHRRPRNRQAQLRHVPHAGLRRAHHRHALADPQAGRASTTAAARSAGRRRAWTWPWPSAPTRPPCTPPIAAACRRTWTKCCSPASCASKPVEMVKCETVTWKCPPTPRSCSKATSSSDELRTEGPFGDHTGFYSLDDDYPVFHVTCITQRKTRSTPPPSSARRPWRTTTWARPSSASSCR